MELRWTTAIVFCIGLSYGQPTPVIRNVANAASGVWNTLSPGVIFTVNALGGTALTDGGSATASTTPLPTRLSGARVLVNGVAAPLFSASPNEIKAQFPVEITGTTSAAIQVEVTTDAGTVMSPALNATVAPFSPGIFFLNQPPFGPPVYGPPAAILRASDSSQICPEGNSACAANPVSAGDVVTIYMTGLGAIDGAWQSGQAAQAPYATLKTPVVIIGGLPANVLFAGVATGFVGLYQVNATVPATTIRGDFVPLIVSMSGSLSNQVSIAIRATSDNAQGGGPPFGAANAVAIDPQNHLTVFAATNNGVFKSTDGAQSWTAINKGLTSLYIQVVAVDPIHAGTVYAGTNQSGIFKSTDGGANWVAINNGLSGVSGTSVRALVIDPRNSQNLYVLGPVGAGNVPGVFKSTDGGASWALTGLKVASGYVTTLAIDPSNPATIYAGLGSPPGWIYKSTDGGANWNALDGLKFTFPNGNTTPISVSSLVIDPSNSAVLYACGGGPQSGVVKSSDGGANWTFLPISSSPSVGLLAIHPSGSTLYAATYQNAFKSNDGGSTWSGITGFPLAFDLQDAATMYGNGGEGVMKSVDGGATWSPATKGLTNGSVSALVVDPRDGASVYAISTLQAGTLIFNSSKVWKTINAATTWSDIVTSSNGISVLAVAPSDPTIVYVTKGGQLYKSTASGASFKAVGVPGNVNSLVIDQSNPNILYATSNGVLIKSTDGGTSWQTLSTKCCISHVAIDPRNSAVIYAGVGGSNMGDGLYKSSDGGATWSAVWTGSAHGVRSLVISQANPSVMFVMSNSGLFAKSVDGGATWTPVSFGITYSYASAVMFDSANANIIYAGTSNGIFISNDGGNTWAASSLGLTNLQINALASGTISGSAVLYVGTGGAGIFKSVDGGATWQPTG